MYMDRGPAPKVVRADPPENTEDGKLGRFLANYGAVAFMGTITVVGLAVVLGIKAFGS
jgi:hypothetical protein